MKIEIRNRCSGFNSYKAAQVKSLFIRGFFIARGRLHIPEGLAHHQVFGRLLDLDTVIFGKAERRRVLNPLHQADFVHVDDDLFAGG